MTIEKHEHAVPHYTFIGYGIADAHDNVVTTLFSEDELTQLESTITIMHQVDLKNQHRDGPYRRVEIYFKEVAR